MNSLPTFFGKQNDIYPSIDYSPFIVPGTIPSTILPITHQATLRSHKKAVTALSLDSSSSRIITGSLDYKLHFYDFPGMTSSLCSFRTIEPAENHQIRSLSWSRTSDRFLVSNGGQQVKLYDRDGFEINTFARGDMYIRDMKHTKGHIACITGVMWHPTDNACFLTCSIDSTVRVWDVNNKNQQKFVLVVKSVGGVRNGRIGIHSMCFGEDGKKLVVGCNDGTLRVWNNRPPFVNPVMACRGAHTVGEVVCSLAVATDGVGLLSRSTDGTVKTWDLRKFKDPVNVANDLPCWYEETGVAFSPNQEFIATGTSIKEGKGKGELVILNKNDLSVYARIQSKSNGVVPVIWDSKTNQIMSGHADGNVVVHFNPETSIKGITLALSKVKQKRIDSVINALPTVHYPDEDMNYVDIQPPTATGKARRLRSDPVATKRPDLPPANIEPVYGPGIGGAISCTLPGDLALLKPETVKTLFGTDTLRDEDPREALLKWDKLTKEDPQFVTPAYKESQPETVYGNYEEGENESEEEDWKAKRLKLLKGFVPK